MNPSKKLMRCTTILIAAAACLTLATSVLEAQQINRVQNFFPTGDRAGSILLIERAAPAEARVGTSIEYQIRITNLTKAAIKNIAVAETFPDNFKVTDVQPKPTQTTGKGAQWTIETLNPDSPALLRVIGTGDRVGDLSECVTISFATQTCLSHKLVQPALKLVKSQPAESSFCSLIPIKLVVTNTGTGAAGNVKVEDQLPEGWTTPEGNKVVRFDAGNLGANQSREFSITAKPSKTGQFVNKAVASADGGLTAEATAQTIVRKPSLTVTKTCPEMRFVGRPATFEIVVANDGDEAAKNTVLVDDIPAGVQVLAASDNGQTSSSGVTWNLGTLEPKASKRVTVTVKPTQITTLKNTARATAVCTEAQASCTLAVKGIPAVLLEVGDEPDPIEVGSTTTYDIVVTNQGSADGTNIVITCTLPEEQSYVTGEGPTKGTVTGKTVTFDPLPTLAPKAKATYKVTVKGLKEGDVRFKVIMKSDQTQTPVEETESTHIY